MAPQLEYLPVDGRDVQIRIFLPLKRFANGASGASSSREKPAVVMVCGLLWLGGGLLGQIGLTFNDCFGYTFAKAGVACVQIHTPIRHIAHTRLLDLVLLLVWPLAYASYLDIILSAIDIAFLATGVVEFSLLLLLPVLRALGVSGPAFVFFMHFVMRGVQWLTGGLPWPSNRPIDREISATIAWTKANQQKLGSDGRIVLCGYSSGAHCAALHALSPQQAAGKVVLSGDTPEFEAVVLISGIYGLPSVSGWTSPGRIILEPVFRALMKDFLGVATHGDRESLSPEKLVARLQRSNLKTRRWIVLAAQKELMGLQPFQDILFDVNPFCTGLETCGATVERMTCGYNHWTLVLNVGSFIEPFCKNL